MPSPVGPDLLTELAGPWVAGLLDASLKGTALLLAATVAARLLRSRPAAMRHVVWAGALVGLLALPVLSGTLPSVEVPGVPDLPARLGGVTSPEAPAAPHADPGTAPSAAAGAAAEAPPAAASSRPAGSWLDRVPLAPALGAVWLLGLLIVLARGLAGRIRVAWLARSATPLRDGPWARTRDRLARGLGLRRDVRLLAGSTSTVPMTWGLVRPRVLLPPEADEWSADCRRNVLMHELAHVRRGDYVLRLIGRVAAAVYWFHPLVWIALRRMRREQEQACDDHVLRSGVKPSEYAGQLVRLARRLRPSGHGVGVGTSDDGPSEFSLRMRSLLRADRPRDAVRGRHFAAAGALAALLVGGLAVLAPAPDRPAADSGPEDPGRAVASVMLPPVDVGDAGGAGDPAAAGREPAPDDGTASTGPEGAEPGPADAPDEGAPASAGNTGRDDAAGTGEGTPARPSAGEPGPGGGAPLFGGGGRPGGDRWTLSALGRPSPFERASRAERGWFDLATGRRAEPSGAEPRDGAGPAAVCPEGCSVEGMVRRLAQRPDSAKRLDLLRRLAEDASARSASVLMELTYRASRASDRRMAVQALADVPGPVGDRYLFQVARANPWVSVRAAAIDELGRSDGDEVVPWLVNLAYNDVSPEVQKFTVSVLARLDRSGAGSGLLQIARSHPADRVRNEAVYWLVRTGRGDVLARLIDSA